MSKETENMYHDDPDLVKDVKIKAKIATNQEKDDIISLMSDVAFRRFVWFLLSKTHIFGISFTGDAPHTFFREGERNIGLRVFELLNKHDPDGYALMVKENSKGFEK
jgi:hypothetical protein